MAITIDGDGSDADSDISISEISKAKAAQGKVRGQKGKSWLNEFFHPVLKEFKDGKCNWLCICKLYPENQATKINYNGSLIRVATNHLKKAHANNHRVHEVCKANFIKAAQDALKGLSKSDLSVISACTQSTLRLDGSGLGIGFEADVQSPDNFKFALVIYIVKGIRPFSFVEDESFRNLFLPAMREWIPGRTTIVKITRKTFLYYQKQLKREL